MLVLLVLVILMMESLVLVLEMRLRMHDARMRRLIEEGEGVGEIMGSSSLDKTPCAVISRAERVRERLSESRRCRRGGGASDRGFNQTPEIHTIPCPSQPFRTLQLISLIPIILHQCPIHPTTLSTIQNQCHARTVCRASHQPTTRPCPHQGTPAVRVRPTVVITVRMVSR